jgi:hypothetical protein
MPVIVSVGIQLVQLISQPDVIIGITKAADSANNVINPATEDTLKAQPSFSYGQTSIGTAATQLTTSSIPCKKGVLVKALASNTAPVYIGDSGVTITSGYELNPKEEVFIPIDNVNKLYGIASSPQKVCWVGV